MKPGDYPLGSELSRAAARSVLERIKESRTKTINIESFRNTIKPETTVDEDGNICLVIPGAMAHREALMLAGVPAKALTAPEFDQGGTTPEGHGIIGAATYRYENGRVERLPGMRIISDI